jgi:hypothetical protein
MSLLIKKNNDSSAPKKSKISRNLGIAAGIGALSGLSYFAYKKAKTPPEKKKKILKKVGIATGIGVLTGLSVYAYKKIYKMTPLLAIDILQIKSDENITIQLVYNQAVKVFNQNPTLINEFNIQRASSLLVSEVLKFSKLKNFILTRNHYVISDSIKGLSKDERKKQFRELSRKIHPDKNIKHNYTFSMSDLNQYNEFFINS